MDPLIGSAPLIHRDRAAMVPHPMTGSAPPSDPHIVRGGSQQFSGGTAQEVIGQGCPKRIDFAVEPATPFTIFS